MDNEKVKHFLVGDFLVTYHWYRIDGYRFKTNLMALASKVYFILWHIELSDLEVYHYMI